MARSTPCADGSELPGFPVHTDPPPHLPLTTSPAFVQNLVPVSYAPIIGGVAVALSMATASRRSSSGRKTGRFNPHFPDERVTR